MTKAERKRIASEIMNRPVSVLADDEIVEAFSREYESRWSS